MVSLRAHVRVCLPMSAGTSTNYLSRTSMMHLGPHHHRSMYTYMVTRSPHETSLRLKHALTWIIIVGLHLQFWRGAHELRRTKMKLTRKRWLHELHGCIKAKCLQLEKNLPIPCFILWENHIKHVTWKFYSSSPPWLWPIILKICSWITTQVPSENFKRIQSIMVVFLL